MSCVDIEPIKVLECLVSQTSWVRAWLCRSVRVVVLVNRSI